MSKKIMSEIDFPRLSRNELYRLSTIVVYAIKRLNRRLKAEEISILNNKHTNYMDYNRLSRKELYRLSTMVVYSIRRLNKRLDEEEKTIKDKKKKSR